MKSLKIVSVLFVLFLFTANASFAQSKLSDAEKKELAKDMKEYLAKLDLTDAQKKPYKEITKKYKKQLTGLKDSDAGKLKKYKEMKGIIENKNTEMRSLLTKQQYEVYLDQQEKNKEMMKEHKDKK